MCVSVDVMCGFEKKVQVWCSWALEFYRLRFSVQAHWARKFNNNNPKPVEDSGFVAIVKLNATRCECTPPLDVFSICPVYLHLSLLSDSLTNAVTHQPL